MYLEYILEMHYLIQCLLKAFVKYLLEKVNI